MNHAPDLAMQAGVHLVVIDNDQGQSGASAVEREGLRAAQSAWRKHAGPPTEDGV